jgi:hypothetical protein
MPTSLIVVGTNSWISLEDAEDYMATRIGAGVVWNTAAEKEAALITAYKQLMGCDKYSLPVAATQTLEEAQCEMALFLLQHQEDMDARKGLQAQGVIQAGMVEETYDKDKVGVMPVPPQVDNLLKDYRTESPIGSAQLERDDDES